MDGFDSFLWEEILLKLTYNEASKLKLVSNYFNSLIECSNKIHRQFLFSEEFKHEKFEVKTRLQIFTRLCCIGNLSLVKWVVRRYNIIKKDVLFNDTKPFRNACAGDEFEIAKWLVETFELEEKDIRTKNDEALKWVGYVNYNFRFLRWIIKKFNIKPKNKEENIEKYGEQKGILVTILNENCLNGRVKITGWLLKKYPELRDCIRPYSIERGIWFLCDYSERSLALLGIPKLSLSDEMAILGKIIRFSEILKPKRKVILSHLRNICGDCSVDFLIGFLDHFKVKKEELLEHNPIVEICTYVNISVLKELVKRYNLNYKTASEKSKYYYEIGFLYACVGNENSTCISGNDRLLMVQYLVEEFGMNTRESTIDSSSTGWDHFIEITKMNWPGGAHLINIKYLTKYFNLSRLEFKKRADGDFYCENIGYIDDEHKYSKEERKIMKNEKYQKWLNSEETCS